MPETRYIETYDGKGTLLGRTPYTVPDEALEREKRQQRRAELRQIFQQVATTGTVPPPDLTALVLKLGEYLALDED